jgi:hypothetical protein
MGPPQLRDVSISGRVNVEEILVPTLVPGEVVIPDNRGSHKGRFLIFVLDAQQPHDIGRRHDVPVPCAFG